MNNMQFSIRNLFLIFAVAAALATAAFGQKQAEVQIAGAAAPQTVDARQSGAWNVGIDPAKNTVKLGNTAADPLAVQVVGGPVGRKPFQVRVFSSPMSTGNDVANITIPAGKRLVIENISAVARIPEGYKMEMAFYTYTDSNGDGVGDVQDITFHRIALTDQGSFTGTQILAANHKVLVFADEQIGTGHFGVGFQSRLNATAPAGAFVQAQLTISGYLEDLPTAP